jgi:hypothetical protein
MSDSLLNIDDSSSAKRISLSMATLWLISPRSYFENAFLPPPKIIAAFS